MPGQTKPFPLAQGSPSHPGTWWQGWESGRAAHHARRLGDHLHRGGQQVGIDLTSPSQGSRVDDQIGQRVEIADRVAIAHLGPFDAQLFGLTVDALGAGALVIHRVVERAVAIEGHAHLATELPVEVLDTAFAFGKLRMVAGLAAWLRKKQRAAKALRAIAVGVGELKGGMHAPAFLTQRHAIRSAMTLRMAMGIEGDGRHAVTMSHHLVHIPGIEGRIGGQMRGKKAQGTHGANVGREEVTDVVFIEGQGVLSQHHIPIHGDDRAGYARAVAPEVFFDFFFGAIALLFVGARAFPPTCSRGRLWVDGLCRSGS